MKVLAIDPGYERVGIAVVERKNSGDKEQLLYSECFETSAELPFDKRITLIGEEVERIINAHHPTCCALETLFFNNNQKTAFRVAEVRGMLIYLSQRNNLKLFEYTPLQVKIAITGYGKSEKKQIIAMVKRLIEIPEKVSRDDEFDAIAIGLTCIVSNHRA